MATALDICSSAAEEIGVKTAEIALEEGDFQIIFSRMNDMLLEWADIGLTPEFQEVQFGTDEVNVQPNARAAVKLNLALRCAPAFQKPITADLAALSASALDRLYVSTDFIGEVAYPDTLPMGSGNQCSDNDIDQRFFPNGKRENF